MVLLSKLVFLFEEVYTIVDIRFNALIQDSHQMILKNFESHYNDDTSEEDTDVIIKYLLMTKMNLIYFYCVHAHYYSVRTEY